MKRINAVFWFVATLIGLECMFFIHSGLTQIGDSDGFLKWMWIFRIATYLGIVAMGFLLFKIKQTLSEKDFFDSRSLKQLRSFGFIALLVAVLNSLANASMNTGHYYKREVSFEKASNYFLMFLGEHVFIHSLIIYVLVMSILMLTYFGRKAIEVKTENEAFI